MTISSTNRCPNCGCESRLNLRTGFVQVFDHSADHQVLCFKERFFGTDHPQGQEWIHFGKKLRAVGIPYRDLIGPTRRELDFLLAARLTAPEMEA